MNNLDSYQRTNASRYEPISEGQYIGSTNRCSCLGYCIALIIVVSILLLPLVMQGSMIFVVGDPVLYALSLVSLYGPILICAVVIKILWDRRKRRIVAEM